VTAAVFDALAAQYDSLWSESAIGRRQRAAVWRCVDPLFQEGEHILDVGCGTGVDAVHFITRGLRVSGIDASPGMVAVAAGRGVSARCLAIEDLGTLRGSFDGAISDFGALNCVADLEPVAASLGRLIRAGGYLAVCLAGRLCAWETLHYLRRGRLRKAFRRWHPAGSRASLGVRVYYPTVRRLARVFGSHFHLVRWCGIGLLVPPSYVAGLAESAVARFAAADRRLAHLPVLRALADHRLLIMRRL